LLNITPTKPFSPKQAGVGDGYLMFQFNPFGSSMPFLIF
jgi:hypothetical protein